MKLYQTKYTNPGELLTNSEVSWTGTLADSSKDRKRLKGDGMLAITTTEVEVPTAKPALMAFLNTHRVWTTE